MPLRHGIAYYAQQLAKSFSGVDYRALEDYLRDHYDVAQFESKFTPMELAIMEGGHSIEDLVESNCKYGQYYCSTDKKWKCRQGPKQSRSTNEGVNQLDKPTPTVAELAKKYGVSEKAVEAELAKGIKVELEHTSDPAVAREIALDHLAELLDY